MPTRNKAVPITQTEELVLGILRAAKRGLTVLEITEIAGGYLETASLRVQLERMADAQMIASSLIEQRRVYRIASAGTLAYVDWAKERDRIIARAASKRSPREKP